MRKCLKPNNFGGTMSQIPSAFSYVTKSRFAKKEIKGGVTLPMLNATKYGYSNARVRAIRSILLKKEFFGELARVRTIDAVIDMLEKTYYKDNLVKLSMYFHGSDLVQIAASLHFAEIAEKLGRITPESDRKIFNILLTKWDIINAKVILNARRLGKKYEEVRPFIIPIGSFTESDVKSLLEGTGEGVFFKFVQTHLGRKLLSSRIISSTELEKLFMTFKTAEIIKIESVLDLFYYSIAITDVKSLNQITKILKQEIDLKNTSTIIRLKQHGITDRTMIEKYFIKGGFKQFSAFGNLIDAKGMQESLKIAARLFELKEAPQSIIALETMLGNKRAAMRVAAFYHSTLSVGVILSFLFLKEEEVNNLRKIAVGKEFNIPDEKIKEMLVFPN